MKSPVNTEDRLREQRDRFVAFAFAAADVLFEIDADNRILYAAGMVEPVYGRTSEQLVGTDFLALSLDSDRDMLDAALLNLRSSGRLERMRIQFDGGPNQGPVTALVSGIGMAKGTGRINLCIARLRGGILDLARQETIANVIDRENFAALAERRVAEARASGEDFRVTLVDLNGANLNRLDPENIERFFGTVGAHLKAWSVAGDSVGRLDERMFGVVHDHSVKPEAIERRISELAQRFDTESLSLRLASMDLKAEGLTPEDVSKSMSFALSKFVEDGADLFSLTSLSHSYEASVADTLAKIATFRNIINSEKLTFVYQPIVDLDSWKILRYEALARVQHGEKVFAPAQFVNFAADLGVVAELDAVVVRRAVDLLRRNPDMHLAVNLAGRSLNKATFLDSMLQTLKVDPSLLPRLSFEITEWADIKSFDDINKVLRGLRSLKCQVCMDDFEPSHAALQFLKKVEVDCVKIDGAVIRDAFDQRHGKAFLKSISALCSEMDIRAIGELVEDESTVKMLRATGITIGQGYYFSRPVPDHSTVTLPTRI